MTGTINTSTMCRDQGGHILRALPVPGVGFLLPTLERGWNSAAVRGSHEFPESRGISSGSGSGSEAASRENPAMSS